MTRSARLGLALGVLLPLVACAAPGDSPADGSASPMASSPAPTVRSPSTAPSIGVSGDPSPTATTGGAASHALDEVARCENPELGFAISYPADWWANERIEPDEPTLTPIEACTYFAPEPVALDPNAGLPSGIAIRIEVRPATDDPGGEVLSRSEATIDGRPATVVELEPTPQAGFVPEGARLYRYAVDLGGGEELTATTDSILVDEETYARAKPILDAMMETLEIDG